MLEVRGLQKHFGGLYALSGLDMEVRRGEIVSVIGPNGAGKSTLFNVITGIYEPDDGDILLLGLEHRGAAAPPGREARDREDVPERPALREHDDPRERDGGPALPERGRRVRVDRPHTRRSARRRSGSGERAEEALAFFGKRLSGYRLEQPAFSLSYANRRRLEMARAMATDPQLLLLDEPTAGMNPRETLELRDHIVRMRDELGLTVIVIEHDMRVVKGVSDRVIACDYGQKIAEGTYEEVANDERVIEAYLGTKAAG